MTKRAHGYVLNEDGDLVAVPAPREHHTPVTYLYDKKGNFLGYRCEDCGLIFTPAGNLSHEKLLMNPPHDKPGIVREQENKTHAKRADAAARAVAGRFRRFFAGLRDRSGN